MGFNMYKTYEKANDWEDNFEISCDGELVFIYIYNMRRGYKNSISIPIDLYKRIYEDVIETYEKSISFRT